MKQIMTQGARIIVVFVCGSILLLLGVYGITQSWHGKPQQARWAQVASAYGYDRSRQQAILFRAAVKDGKIIDRSNLDLPLLDAEAEEGRRLNFDRCRVGLDVYEQSGAIKGWRVNDPTYRFALDVDPATWATYDDKEGVLTMAECYFTAGDSRVGLRIPVYGTNKYKPVQLWKGELWLAR
jgi:hypothetical protein